MIPIPPQIRLAWEAGKLWFLLAAAVAVFGFGLYAGMRWEEADTQKALRQRDDAVGLAQAWETRATSLDVANKRWAERYAADEQRRREQAERAAKVLDDLAKAAAKAESEEQEWRAKFREATRSPDCAELAKVTTCAAFSGY